MSNKKENLKSTHTESSNDSCEVLTCPTCGSGHTIKDDFLQHCITCRTHFSSRTRKIYESDTLDSIKRSFADHRERQIIMFVRLANVEPLKCQCGKKENVNFSPCCSHECWSDRFEARHECGEPTGGALLCQHNNKKGFCNYKGHCSWQH